MRRLSASIPGRHLGQCLVIAHRFFDTKQPDELTAHFQKAVSFLGGKAENVMDEAESTENPTTTPPESASPAPVSRSEIEEGSDTVIFDMLQERLEELRTVKLKEDRSDTVFRRAQLKELPPDAQDGFLPTQVSTAVDNSVIESSSSYFPVLQGHHQDATTTRHDGTFSGDVAHPLQGSPEEGVPLLRALQRSGFCSRRQAIESISGGRVKVDNVVERDPFRVVVASNDLTVEGHKGRLRFAAPRLWAFHKPANVIVGRKDAAGRMIFMRYAAIMGFDHMIPVGSMPFRSHGILLLTNDGDLSQFLEHPDSAVQSTYLFRVNPPMDAVLAQKLNDEGVDINGVIHKNYFFSVDNWRRSPYAVKVKVRGKTMPIHQLFQHLGRKIIRGGRISFGPYLLRGLAPGTLREVPVPPFFMKHVNPIWKPFVERDWPYFRKIRIERLKRMSFFRMLTKAERQELDAYSFEELKNVLSFDAHEVSEEAARMAETIRRRPSIEEVAPPHPATSLDDELVVSF